MAFKNQWTDKVNGVDVQSANDVNLLARGIIQNESDISALQTKVEALRENDEIMDMDLATLEESVKGVNELANKAFKDISNNALEIAKNKADIKELQENGGTGGSELFVIQWNGSTGDKTYAEVAQAIAEHKIPVLYQGDKCIATFSGDNDNGSFVFARSDLYTASIVNEYLLHQFSGWVGEYSELVKYDVISANDPTFKTAVLNCFPDADTMSFPLEETVSEVSEE